MSQLLNMNIQGLYTHPNEFSEAPAGALSVADNIVVDRESIAQTRRGQKQYGNMLTVTNEIDRMFEYQDKIIIHYDNTLAYDSDGTGNWTGYSGSFADPTSTSKIHSIQGNKNFYFNTSTGVKKLDAITGTPIDAGAYKALGGTSTQIGTAGFQAINTSIAYRLVWGYYDANSNLVLGTPSQRAIVSNASANPIDVDMTYDIPDNITTTWIYQLYRSAESASSSTAPDDELQLVFEASPTAGEITAQSVTISDTTLNDLRGAALYTNTAQQSILQTNDQPPFCKDMTVFKDHYFYANTKTKHRFSLELLATGSPAGIQINDTITIAGTVYTGKAAENVGLNEFLVYSAGTASQNIDTTALSLIKVINQSASNTEVYAYYLSGYDDIPGSILLEERSIGGSSYAVISSRATCWSPKLPSSGTTESSSNEEALNRIYISKQQQPEAVPLTNYMDLGSADKPIKRILALRDSVMVFKDDGIFRITGSGLPFASYPFNDSIKLRGVESAVVLDNRIYAMTDQGVVAVHDAGVEIISRPIENTLNVLLSSVYTNFESATFGVAYESDRRFILYTVTETDDTTATQAFTYNTITRSWTRWTTPRSAGLVKESDDKLYTAHASSDYIYQERKLFSSNDFADEEYTVTITGYSGTTVNMSSTTDVVAGQTLLQGNLSKVVVSVDSGTAVTVTEEATWANASATVNTPITSVVQWVSQAAENPALVKHWREMSFIFETSGFNTLEVEVFSNFAPKKAFNITPSSGSTLTAWGSGPWGSFGWGAGEESSSIIRTFFPRESQRANWVNIKLTSEQAFTSFSLAGLSAMYKVIGPKFR